MATIGSSPDALRIANFSNPDVTVSGEPTGVPVDHVCDPASCPGGLCTRQNCSQEFPAHNAFSINNTAQTVANFRIADCNGNQEMDLCDVNCSWPGCNIPGCGTSQDCNNNWFPDECEPDEDCNVNGTRDICDIGAGTSEDCNGNSIPDECEPDCNENGIADSCDILDLTDTDFNRNGVPHLCEFGACCLPDASCGTRLEDCCSAAGGWFLGDDATCPSGPVGACCLPNGSCVNTLEGCCTGVIGRWAGGAGATCETPGLRCSAVLGPGW